METTKLLDALDKIQNQAGCAEKELVYMWMKAATLQGAEVL